MKTFHGLIGRFPRAVIYSFIRVIALIILQNFAILFQYYICDIFLQR